MALRIDQLAVIAKAAIDPTVDLAEVHDNSATSSRKINLQDLVDPGAGGAVRWADFVPTSITNTTSDGTTGNVSTVGTMFDGNYYQIEEAGGTPGYDIEFVFSGVTAYPKFVVTRWLYSGSATHDCTWDIWNYTTSAWDELRAYTHSKTYYHSMTQYIPLSVHDDYVSAGAAKVRVYHHTVGNPGHYLQVDYVGLTHCLQGVI